MPAQSICGLGAALLAISLLAGCGTTGRQGASAPAFRQIPAPAGFVEGSALSKKIKNVGLACQGADSTLLGIYYPSNRLAEILATGTCTEFPRTCVACALEEWATVGEATNAFAQYVHLLKANSSSYFRLNNPEMRRALKKAEAASRKLEPSGGSGGVSGMSVPNTILETNTAYALSMVANLTWSQAQTPVQTIPTVQSFAYIRLDKQLLALMVFFEFRDAGSINACNQKLLEWVAEVQKLNARE
jgi:hypothetical protein